MSDGGKDDASSGTDDASDGGKDDASGGTGDASDAEKDDGGGGTGDADVECYVQVRMGPNFQK